MKLIFIINKTALHIAAEKGNLDIISILIAHQNIDVNSRIIFNCIHLNEVEFYLCNSV